MGCKHTFWFHGRGQQKQNLVISSANLVCTVGETFRLVSLWKYTASLERKLRIPLPIRHVLRMTLHDLYSDQMLSRCAFPIPTSKSVLLNDFSETFVEHWKCLVIGLGVIYKSAMLFEEGYFRSVQCAAQSQGLLSLFTISAEYSREKKLADVIFFSSTDVSHRI